MGRKLEDLDHVSYGDQGRHVSRNSTGKVGIGTGSTSATATLEVAGTALVENAKLKAIAESNTDTAVDVFVYDTRKDSDGGAWRKRTQTYKLVQRSTQHKYSWSKKRISMCCCDCCRGCRITIYDGDDPDMPMWMVFNRLLSIYIGTTISAVTQILNGIMLQVTLVGAQRLTF